jgi:hypothetical protein
MYLFHHQFVPFFADEGRVRYMINNRFGHNCTFNIPEYNVYFLIVYYKDIVTVFQMKQYHSIIKKPFCFSHTFVCNNSAVLHPCNTDAVLHLIMIWTYINHLYYISKTYISFVNSVYRPIMSILTFFTFAYTSNTVNVAISYLSIYQKYT